MLEHDDWVAFRGIGDFDTFLRSAFRNKILIMCELTVADEGRWLEVLPIFLSGRLQNGIADLVRFYAIAEVRVEGWFARFEALKETGDAVCERVLVADV